jgi:2-polyprenyl-3-methyl-5-hydroxy-6-metoxy-1,4-benzoquinol methylase
MLMHRLREKISSLGRQSVFTHYYRTNHWRDPESRSGPGSRRDSHSVQHTLEVLTTVTERYAIRTISDIPCGDFNWINTYLDASPGIHYIGFDIVTELVERNQRTFPDRRFTQFDIVTSVPPSSDLIFCKDLLNHLKDGEIVQAIANMNRSGSKYLLATNNFGYSNKKLRRTRRNSSRHVDLTIAPFNYPEPLWHDHYWGLWVLADMEPLPHLAGRTPRKFREAN